MVKKEIVVEKKERINTNSQGGVKVEKILVENFVSLQQVMTNLAVKFDNLSTQISKLLELFEISAKALVEKGSLGEDRGDQRAAEKLDSLLEQSKVIAKGIALLHERNPPEQHYTMPNQNFRPMQQQRPSYDFSKNPRMGK